MVYVVQLLGLRFPLYSMCHFLNVSKHEVREIQHLYSSEMHEESNMIGIQPGEPTFTSEVLDNNSHQRHILLFQKLKGE